jgi:two-component system NarL family sensor kinase
VGVSAGPRHPTLPWNSVELRDGVRTIAIQRVVAVPVLGVAGLAHGHTVLVPFAILIAVAFVAELVQLRLLFSEDWARVPLPALLFLDVAMLAVAATLTGGAQSPVAFIGLLSIFPATFAFGPRYMAWMCAWVAVTLGGVVLVDGLQEDDTAIVVGYLGALVMLALICVNAARVREASSEGLRELAAARRRLVADAASAEAVDRKRISQQLHDAALQSLLSARQDLDEVAAGEAGALQFARDALQASVDTVRDLVYDIDPAALAGTRLPEALRGLVDRVAAEDGVVIDATIDTDATGPHDELLHAVARQLLRSAIVQSGARNITVSLRRGDSAVDLEVRDDGGRTDFDAHEEGTVGIASAAARVDAAGGTLDIRREGDQGTGIAVHLPDTPPT